jgi:hypothetical protein
MRQVVFGMFGGFMFLVYVGSAIYGERRRRQRIEAETTRGVHEVEDALKIGMPYGGGDWEKRVSERKSWNTESSRNSKATLVNPRTSFGSLTHQQQVSFAPVAAPGMPQTKGQMIFAKQIPRLPSMSSVKSIPSVGGSSVYSPQLTQPIWSSQHRALTAGIPVRSSSMTSPKVPQHSFNQKKTPKRASTQSFRTLPSIKSVSSLYSSAKAAADGPGSYVPRLTGSRSTMVRSKTASWPVDVPKPNDEDYYLYRFGYGKE